MLIVEDEFLIALDLKLAVEEMGFRTCGPAGAGREALELARRERPDLLLTDLRLRDDLDGIEAARAIVAADPMPVIFITAYNDEEVRRKVDAFPNGLLLNKPISRDGLRAAVRHMLASEASPAVATPLPAAYGAG